MGLIASLTRNKKNIILNSLESNKIYNTDFLFKKIVEDLEKFTRSIDWVRIGNKRHIKRKYNMSIEEILQKNKYYCNICFKENKITELNKEDNSNNLRIPNCGHSGRYFSFLKWCEECQDFTSHRGFNSKSLCYRCIMKKNCKTAIDKGLHSCQNPKTSLANKELHQKTISAQIKNKTFNMMNPKIHKIATANKLKNYASGNCKCNKCGNIGVLNSFGLCSECQSKVAKEVNKPKFCEECKDITPHNGKCCLVCHPESASNSIIYFIEKDNQLYYFDNLKKKYILWDEFKNKIKTQFVENDFIFDIKNKYLNAKIISTFRSQNSNNWAGSKSAFEKSLVEQNISWFVYIKFDENNNPLVVGKSGSLLVNFKGSDISFSTDIGDGPARRYLNEENLNWNKTQILVIPCNSEKEAFKIEKEIQKNYNLFGS